MSDWYAVLDEEVSEVLGEQVPAKSVRHPSVQCLCGRFAKWMGDQHYYNGQFDCYRYTVLCSRCGTVDVECV